MSSSRAKGPGGPTLQQKLLGLPSFVIGVFLLYWSVPLGVLMGFIQVWKLRGTRDDGLGWGRALQTLFGVRMLLLPSPPLSSDNPVVFLSNHRSWADFFLDVVATGGRAQMLSRWAVFWAFPAMMSAVVAIKAVVLFQRGAPINKVKFNALLDAKIAGSEMEGLIVYPEGHRSTARTSLPLKRGMLAYVFSRKLPVQIVMSANKEAVVSEKHMSCHFGQDVLVGYSETLPSSSHATLDAFVARVQQEWDAQWQRVNSADWTEARELQVQASPSRDYPMGTRMVQLGAVGANFVAFGVVLWGTWRGLLCLLSLAGPWQAYVSALLAVWTAASLLQASRKVHLPLKGRPGEESVANGVIH